MESWRVTADSMAEPQIIIELLSIASLDTQEHNSKQMKGIDFGWEAGKKFVKLQQQTGKIFLCNVCTEDFFRKPLFFLFFQLAMVHH